MAIEILRDVRAYDTQMCSFRAYRKGRVLDGPEAVWLLGVCPGDVRLIAEPDELEPIETEPVKTEPDASDADAVDSQGETTTAPAIEDASPEPPQPVQDDEPAAAPDPDFDPFNHNGPAVIAYAKANPTLAAAVFAAEAAPTGKQRTTVLVALRDLTGKA